MSNENTPHTTEEPPDNTQIATFASYTAPDWIIKAANHEITSSNLTAAPHHASPACESALLASISSPQVSDESTEVLVDKIGSKKLSLLQMEGAALAIQRHNRVFMVDDNSTTDNDSNKNPSYSKVRGGFFIADGAGVGKGRQIASVLMDSFARSYKENTNTTNSTTENNIISFKRNFSNNAKFRRRRHLWVSVSRELIQDAQRDLTDLGCHVPVLDGVEVLNGKTGGGLSSSSSSSDGVLFVTYAFLASGKGKRLEDIIRWLTRIASPSKKAENKGTNQSQNISEEEFDGCIIFDEAHKAKNLNADPPTVTGKCVFELQRRLPQARVLYCSATGVSDLKQLGYAVRLNIWGAGTVYGTFSQFLQTMEKRGVGAMELLALEMKQQGCLVARTLAWKGAEFETIQVELSEKMTKIYDNSVKFWNRIKHEIAGNLKRPDMQQGSTPSNLWRAYWSAHQRFFKDLAISAKIQYVVEDAKKYLHQNHAVVIGLQSTGESNMQTSLDEITAVNHQTKDLETIELSTIPSTAASIASNFVRNHYPVKPEPREIPKVPTRPADGFASMEQRIAFDRYLLAIERMKMAPPPKPIPELVAKRESAIKAIQELHLPPNFLDQMIDEFGGVDKVAEMTGRSGRIVRNGPSFNYTKRIAKSSKEQFGLSVPVCEEELDRLNITEKKKFMDGKKTVAIISDAASTGISLHAALGSTARDKRRVHYTIELPWAADKAIQQLGRTHRSGQKSAPLYKMVVTTLGGERRFAAAVAKRMASLGALTKGDRRAASGSDFSEFDIDSKFGRRSLKRLYDATFAQPPALPSRGARQVILSHFPADSEQENDVNINEDGYTATDLHVICALETVQKALDDVGITKADDSTKNAEVKVFLNRIAGLPVQVQNCLFNLFMSTMDDVITEAKTSGEYEGSAQDVKGTSIEVDKEPELLITDPSSEASTYLRTFIVDRGVSFESVLDLAQDINFSHGDNVIPRVNVAESGFYMSRRKIGGRSLVLFAKRKFEYEMTNDSIDTDPLGLVVVTRPNTGTNPYEMATNELDGKYSLIASAKEIQAFENKQVIREKFTPIAKMWDQHYNESNKFENNNTGLAPRKMRVGLITGAVLQVLPVLEKVVASRSMSERSLRVMRIEVTEAVESRFVGVRFPIDHDALNDLRDKMAQLKAARNGLSARGWVDRSDPVNPKSLSWILTKPQTISDFFKPKPKGSPLSTNGTAVISLSKRKAVHLYGNQVASEVVILDDENESVLNTTKTERPVVTNSNLLKKKKQKSSMCNAKITSFFGKK